MKIFTHSYKITIYENGKFCWKNKGWVESDNPYFYSILLTIVWAAILIDYFY